jgi:hypothetical protein
LTAPAAKISEGGTRKLSEPKGLQEDPKEAPRVRNVAQFSPQEEFRDRQAYRAELRSALAAVNLDDLHDLAGNALFRLQFKATLFPGEFKSKFGVARLTVIQPHLKSDEVASIYRIWLGHLSSRLNYFDAQARLVGDTQYQNSGISPRFAHVVRIGLTKNPSEDAGRDACLSLPSLAGDDQLLRCHPVSLTVAPAASAQVRDMFSSDADVQFLKAADALRTLLATPDGIQVWCDDWLQLQQLSNLIKVAYGILAATPSLEAALDGIVAGSGQVDQGHASGGGQADDLLDLRLQYQRLGSAAAGVRSHVNRLVEAAESVLLLSERLSSNASPCSTAAAAALAGTPAINSEIRRKALRPPEAFTAALVENDRANGQAYAFGTTPAELAQRLSTTASASASLEVALALSLSSNRQDASAQAGSGFARSAAQTAAALERVPLVVGFSDRHLEQDREIRVRPKTARTGHTLQDTGIGPGKSTHRVPQFGWVFGPKMRFDGKRFVFEQSVASYDLAADLSVPSWWPRIEMEVETAWVANWHDKKGVLSGADRTDRTISVPLPVNRADLDGLTKFLTRDSVRRSVELTRSAFPWFESYQAASASL